MNSHIKILIIRFSSIGDILLTTPFLKQIKTTFPDAQISYLVKKEFENLVKFNPNVNNTIPFDTTKGLGGLLFLRKNLGNYDYIFDLHNNLRSNRITSIFDKSRVFKIKKNKIKRALFVYIKINLFDKIITAPERYLNTAQSIGIKDNGEKLQLHWDGITGSSIEKLLSENKLSENRYICIAPGAAHYTKRWPLKYAVKLITKVLDNSNFKIAIVGGPKENKLITEFEENEKVVNFAGRLNLLETAGIIKNSRGILTNDSGLMHMASAVNRPLIAIFGSTTRELGFFPYRSDSVVLENREIWCRPCTHMGRSYCPLGHFDCMKSITVKDVFNKVSDKLLT